MTTLFRYLTSGESHGSYLTAIVEGVPAGLEVKEEVINHHLRRRQKGYGRGGRMKIESDSAQIISGVRWGKTLGSPITMLIKNRDWENWKEIMAINIPSRKIDDVRALRSPRPGHADLAGALKYRHRDVRSVLERASARETAARTAVGGVARILLEYFGIKIFSYVTQIGPVKARIKKLSVEKTMKHTEKSDLRCPDPEVTGKMKALIRQVKKEGETVGGIFEVKAEGVPPGLGSYVQWDRRLDGRLAGAVMSIQAVKGVEIGLGFRGASKLGSQFHDEIFYSDLDVPTDISHEKWHFNRKTNNAGGFEGGVSNGEEIVLRAFMKPISTLRKALRSYDIETKMPTEASWERSDVCAVPAAAVVAEGVMAIELAKAFLEKFGGDAIEEVQRNYEGYLDSLADY